MEEKSAKLKKLQKIRRNFRFLRRVGRRVLPLLTTTLVGISGVKAQELPKSSDFEAVSDLYSFNAQKKNIDDKQLVIFDVRSEVSKRADWFVNNFLDSAKRHLNALKTCNNKTAYVKREFFDEVSPIRHLSGSNAYCITALNRCLIDANRLGGDWTGVLPNPNDKECSAANECNAFANFLSKKGYEDCIDRGRIDYNKLEPGDIILTVRNNSGSRHARQYIGQSDGKRYCLSFNNDGIGELKNTSAIVIHVKKITEKAIIQNLEKEHLISDSTLYDNIMPWSQAQKIKARLAQGREEEVYLISERLRLAGVEDIDRCSKAERKIAEKSSRERIKAEHLAGIKELAQNEQQKNRNIYDSRKIAVRYRQNRSRV